LSISKKQDIANKFTSGCLNISIANESASSVIYDGTTFQVGGNGIEFNSYVVN